jgi:hypothetical protein
LFSRLVGGKLTRKVNVTAYIELEDLERLEDLSRETGESISAIICTAVKEFLDKKLKPAEEAKV